MRGTHGHIAIDLCAELLVLALAASQDCIDQAGCARMSEVARSFDRFGHGRMRGNLRVQQLTQADDRECTHVGLDLLTRARQQAIEQRIEPQIPANAVVRERTEQTALLARGLRVDRQSDIERTAAHRHVRNDLRSSGTNCGRAAHDPSTAPSRRCALRNSAADIGLATGALHSRQSQNTLACADVDARGTGAQYLAGIGRRRRIDGRGLPDAQLLTVPARLRHRPGIECANLPVDLRGRPRPVDRCFFLANLRRVGNTVRRLRTRRCRALRNRVERIEQCLRTERCEAVMQACAGFARVDRYCTREQHRPGVETGLHLHDRYAGLGIAGGNRALNRRSTAPARQQRSVNVDAAEPRRLQDGLRKQQSVRGDDHDVCGPALQPFDRGRLAQRRRLLDRQAMPSRRTV